MIMTKNNVTAQTGDEPMLLPCPFCGGAPQLNTDGESGYWIECTEPACGSSTNMRVALMDDVRQLLREPWNRRTASDRFTRDRQALQQAIDKSTNARK